jgi:hypothetical protein
LACGAVDAVYGSMRQWHAYVMAATAGGGCQQQQE